MEMLMILLASSLLVILLSNLKNSRARPAHLDEPLNHQDWPRPFSFI